MINCIAVDDEPLALDLIADFVKKVPFLQLVRRCNNAIEAIQALQEEKIDLAFLDIEMPHLTGIQFMKNIKNQPMVILTTAYDNYALEGFNLDAVDYLLKPILFERFLKAVNKAYDLHELKSKNVFLNTAVQDNTDDYLFVKADYKMLKINLKDIIYIEGLKDYLKIYAGSKPILTLQSLKVFEEKLPSKDFIRVHRSYIVSLHKIDSIHKNRIQMGSKEIPIGDLYSENLFKIINLKNI